MRTGCFATSGFSASRIFIFLVFMGVANLESFSNTTFYMNITFAEIVFEIITLIKTCIIAITGFK